MSTDFLNQLTAVIFDFDGTLANTQINFAEMRRRTVEHVKARGLWEDGMDDGRFILEVIDLAAEKLASKPDDLASYRRESAQILEDVELLTCPDAEPFPGTIEALQSLCECGYRTGIITRNCRAGVEAVLRRHPLHHEVLLTRDDVQDVKPHKAHLLEALDTLGVSPKHAVMVGDHVTDVECGLAAGTFTCGVLTEKTTREQLEEAGAHLVVENVAALAQLLCGAHDQEP